MIADKGDELAMTLALLGASAQQRGKWPSTLHAFNGTYADIKLVEENAAHDKIEKTFKDARKATSFNGKGKARATPRKSIRTRRDQPGWQIKGNRLECEELALRFASCLATKVHE
jgi:hypothetical protein